MDELKARLAEVRGCKMADVKKIATRDSYGSALAELGASHPDLIVFDATWPAPPRPPYSRRRSPTATLTAASPRRI